MSQLLTLLWLKRKLLRNSLRSSRAVVNQAASVLGMLIGLCLALGVATGLGFASYFLSKPGALSEAFRQGASREGFPVQSAEFIFFSILAFLYLMWATVPLSIGGGKQFDAGKMLIYPISLQKLFAIDFVSEITALQSVFAIPAILAMGLGAGLGTGNLFHGLIATLPTILFGMALSKWLSTSIGSLVRRKRARGETIVALIGAIAGIGGALAGQLGPILIKHADSFRGLRWTPPGAAAYLLAGSNDTAGYLLSFVTLSAYTVLIVIFTYWTARRSALGLGGERKRKVVIEEGETHGYSGWEIPLVSPQLAAVIEKELRYALRNAQIRMLGLMPLILIVIRLVQSQRMRTALKPGGVSQGFLTYGTGLFASLGVLYVFLLLSGMSCNLFAFEEGGMRSFILAPIERSKILLGKNLVVTLIQAVFSTALLLVNEIVFRDMGPLALLFAALSFVVYASLAAVFGNWFSITFPKRMHYGKRMNVSGVAGLLMIPVLLTMAIPPISATVAGYYWQSLLMEFAVLGLWVLVAVSFYVFIIEYQGRSLAKREIGILEAVKERSDGNLGS
jgi:hypothetical protein